ncbi:MAG TPA: DUF4843 domain-containing protein [Phnomibacter sp.]|nr:DUF4843 domain-containing protein [Phnomibacter sp.]
MKKGIVYIITLVVVGLITSCDQDLPVLFSEQDGIYFSGTTDSLSYTFAKFPKRTTDTLKLPVTVLGKASDVDRVITIEKVSAPDADAIEGVHFKLLTPYTMPANKVSTTIPIVIYRTPDLDSLSRTFIVHVKANETFQEGIDVKTQFKVKMGYIQKPPSWGEFGGIQWAGYSANFGTWTKTKYKLILDALYDPVSDSTVTEFPIGNRFAPPALYLQYLQIVRNYIRTNYPGNLSVPLGIGPTLRDPDANNNVIVVGPANY